MSRSWSVFQLQMDFCDWVLCLQAPSLTGSVMAGRSRTGGTLRRFVGFEIFIHRAE
jgi:hypothetical protein